MYRNSHATVSELLKLVRDGKYFPQNRCVEWIKLFYLASLCNGKVKKEISLSHINDAFNQDIKVDLLVVTIYDTKQFILI